MRSKPSILNNKGYTLIEMLAVIIILTVVGSLIVAIIVLSLRGGNRSRNVDNVRQIGNSALFQMTKMITFARSFRGIAANGDVNPVDGSIQYSTQCTAYDSENLTQYKYLKLQSFDRGVTTLICHDDDDKATDAVDIDTTLASYSAALKNPLPVDPLVDTGRVIKLVDTKKYDLKECYFTCQQSNLAFPPIIQIHFIISTLTNETLDANGQPNQVENSVSIPFDATVNFRNN